MNRVTLLGRLTKDVESKVTTNGVSVCLFSLAVNRKFKKDGEPDADFFNIKTFAKTAEFCSKYFTKGSQIALSGRIENRSWQDAQGVKRYATDIIADEVFFADSKRESQTVIPTSKYPDSDNYDDANEDTVPF
jgi:single-strand DNA-binding protein